MIHKVYYNSSFFSHEICKHALRYVNALPTDVRGLISIGASGCAIGSAMLLLCDRLITHVHYRKRRESAHRNSPTGFKNSHVIYTIVDDFIDTGGTVINLLKMAKAESLIVKYVLVDSIWHDENIEEITKSISSYGAECIFPK